MAPSPVIASQKVHDLLRNLHAASTEQEKGFSYLTFWIQKRILSRLAGGRRWSAKDDNFMRDKFVALEEDKSQFVYLLARSIGAVNIVEAGTSFGVSTIYLALAAGQNAAAAQAAGAGGTVTPGQSGKVIATEMEPTKAQKAREHWKEAGDEVEPWITLLEGDLREMLAPEVEKLDKVDFLLLDIWTQMALPALKVVHPKLRPGALIIADNTTMARSDYKELFEYLHDPANGFRTLTTPFKGGLEVAVYVPFPP